ncbi:aldose 1-epimerase family protein [Tomitella fengzijianii]|uniref:Aldose 1-epimerase family protein n=1 Tax=Tomitella fengzijianii TaxID=2597660 RepID=A0A516X6C4_9ACTN|nr:aldose 1-epimerase family protein [Tomitella fengzijianii]QDQ98590.1 aldose 1-epimerase family protein [Tomitella fengzijianii]
MPDGPGALPRFVPSGRQWEIRHAGLRAVIVEVGGGIRTLTSGERDVLEGYPVGAMCDGAHGAPLIPWPNRLADGRYTFDGAEHRTALTEPARGNAIHGLLRWRPYALRREAADAVTVGAVVHPSPGYPFALDVEIEYRLDDGGLTVATTARNVGPDALPYAHGQHPYLSAGTGTLDRCVLEFDAATRILVDDRRALPSGSEPTECTDYDFRGGRILGALRLDDPFTDLRRDGRGLSWVRLTGGDGRTVEQWADAAFGCLQLFSGDTLAPGRRRTALAAEPMTAPPNALATGESVVRLEPGERFISVWGVRLV